MSLQSAAFLFFFFPLAFALDRALPGVRWKNRALLLFSLIFYAFGQWRGLPVLLLSAAIAWAAGVLLTKRPGSRWVLATALALHLGLLGCFKYLDFFAGILGRPGPGLAAPLGISFFTFKAMSYVIDVCRGGPAAERFPDMLLYISFFPQAVSGPITRFDGFAAQLRERTADPERTARGLRRFTAGLGKKLLIAALAAPVANTAFSLGEGLDVRTAWLGAAAYAIQLYFDFSGYSDMAIGLGRMLGFEFLENFNYPYISKSIVEFWRRWHISLTTWFREYVYIPLGGNRVPKAKWIRNILIVWLLTGIWHGAGWNFLLWGLYYGVWMLAERLFLGKYLEKLPSALQHVYTMIIVLTGWALFAVEDMNRLGVYFMSLFGGGGLFSAADGYRLRTYLPTLVILAIGSTPLMKNLWDKLNEKTRNILQPLLVLAALILCTASLVDAGYNPFLYFRF